MTTYFDTTIKPLNDALGKTLELRGLSKSIWQAKRLAVLGKHAAATLAGDNTAIRAANEEREQIDKQLKMWEKNNGNN